MKFFHAIRHLHPIPSLLKKTGMVIGLLLMLMHIQAQTQITTVALPNGTVGDPYPGTNVLTATPDAGAGGVDIFWSATGMPAGLSISPTSGTTVSIVGTPTTSGLSIVEFTAVSLDAGSNPVGTDDIAFIAIDIAPAVGTPVSVMLVLDQSGSMNGSISGLTVTGYGTEITSNSKWNVLKVVCNDFLAEWDNLRDEPTDQVAIQFFDDTHSQFPGGFFDFSALPISPGLNAATSGSLLEYMGDASNQPSGWTCIGGAIQTGYNDFPGGVQNGNIIIFTDGMQNRDPSVNATGDLITNVGSPAGTGFDPNPPTLDLTSLGEDVVIHTIHLGDNAAADLMNDVAVASDGSHFSIRNIGGADPATATEQLNEFLTAWDQVLVNSLEGLSPKIGDIVYNTMGESDPQNHEFIVDSLADIVLFKMVKFNASANMAVSITKDGQSLLTATQSEFSEFYRFSRDDMAQFNLDIAGTWTVTVETPFNGTAYSITQIIEEEAFDFNISIGDQDYEPGDNIPLLAQLAVRGDSTSQTIVDADSVYVLVAKPGEDFNTIFSQATVSGSSGNASSGNNPQSDATPGDAKFNALLNDPSFLDKLKLENRFILLSNEGNGQYSGNFSDTELSGFYRFRFYMRGSNDVLGAYRRLEQVSTVIDFGAPSESNSDVSGNVVTSATATTTMPKGTYITYTPRNQFNYFLGPNRLGQIDIRVGGDKAILRDNLDGTYTAFSPIQANEETQISIVVKGKTGFKGLAKEIEGMPGYERKTPPFSLPFGLGITSPVGDFSNTWGQGLLIELHGEYNVNKNLSINLEGGLYTFNSVAGDSSLSVAGVAAGPRLNLPLNSAGSFNFFLDANGGVYFPSGETATFGYNVGAGFAIDVSSTLSLVPEVSYYQILTDPTPISFLGLGVGLQVALN
ncbi:MAG: vWA domain-containing protein [Bacteroidota bacterium]